MIRLAASNTPVQIAWAEFDDAALRLHQMYATADPDCDDPVASARRMQMAIEVARLWDKWQKLFLGDGDGPGAAA